MTDEELRVRAIQELEFYKKDDTFMLADITVDLAIEALEQMPVTTTVGEGGVIYYPQVEGVTPTVVDAGKQEPCDNAVSRQDVLDLAKKGILVSNGNYESVCKAINELPSVNPQPCEDAISRTEVIKSIDEREDVNGKVDAESVRTDIVLMQPVNPQPKAGHWEWLTENKYRCSNCKHETRVDECMSKPMYDFCPFCRARMESEE